MGGRSSCENVVGATFGANKGSWSARGAAQREKTLFTTLCIEKDTLCVEKDTLAVFSVKMTGITRFS